MTNERLRERIKQRYQRKVAGQPQPDEDDPLFSFVATKPVADAVFTAADAIDQETVALCVRLTRTNYDEMLRLITDCWRVAEEDEVELRVYLGYAGNILFSRPGYEHLRSHVEAGEIDTVLVGERPSPFAPTENQRTEYMQFWRDFFRLCKETGTRVESFDPSGRIVPSAGREATKDEEKGIAGKDGS